MFATDVLRDELCDALSAKPPRDVANLRLDCGGAGARITGRTLDHVLELIQVRL